MADTLTISLAGPLADDIRAAAAARGVSPEEYVRQRLAFDAAIGADSSGLDDDDIGDDLTAAAAFERTGQGVPWAEVRDWMQSWGTAKEKSRPAPRKLR